MRTIKIIGTPMQKQSARFVKTGSFMRSYQPKELQNYIAQAKIQLINQLPSDWKPIEGKVIISGLVFIFPPLKTWSQKKTKALEAGEVLFKESRPDLDNLQKSLFDICNGLLWRDDSQIVRIEQMEKVYGFQPMTELILAELIPGD